MKCEYCELRRVGPFVISKACAMLSGKLKNKQTGEPLKICMHHMTSPDPCMNNGNGCSSYTGTESDRQASGSQKQGKTGACCRC